MNRAEAALADYQEYHQTRANKLTHFLGIPTIVFSLIGMLRHLAFPGPVTVDGAMILMVVATAFYLYLDWRFALAMLAVASGCYVAAPHLGIWVHVGLQVGGWIFQFIGHGIEGRKPAFLKNITHLLVGPMWILNDFLNFIPKERYRTAAAEL
jgi:uncharacterized membrane protein YGL010W